MSEAIVGGLAALLGLMLGRYWDVRLESRRWRRDERVRSYQGLTTEYFRLREAIRRVAQTDSGSDQFEQIVEESQQVGIGWNRELVAVWVHGSQAAAVAARRLNDALLDLNRAAKGRGLSVAEWHEVRVPVEECLEAFIDMVRADLLLPPLPITLHPNLSRT